MAALPHTAQLLAIMARLRDPNGGCPWDLEQDFSTIAPYTIEEAYEVADAIARGDMQELQGELGDLLLQVVFHSQMAGEKGLFDFEAVAQSINDKMIRRHPHVFSQEEITTAQQQTGNWERIKQAERKEKQKGRVLDDVPAALPALMRAQKLQKRAARVGFDWPDVAGVLDKLHEELDEARAAIASGDRAHIAEEIGDLLFSVVNLARFMDVDAEDALRAANQKFTRRFEAVEDGVAASGNAWDATTLDEMEALWKQAKEAERSA
ncbi:MAG: nucleoside triphosphate pyrophosphohydrolase [Azospirillum brasilense]|nr:MAG: nucleoside triphosphate pyrophosphohydrolase [Azospirillum brasilense]